MYLFLTLVIYNRENLNHREVKSLVTEFRYLIIMILWVLYMFMGKRQFVVGKVLVNRSSR